MKKYGLARALRALGRMALFTGSILSLGLVIAQIYVIIYRFQHPEQKVLIPKTIVPQEVAGTALSNPNPFVTGMVILASVSIVVILVALIVKIYNGHMRNIISRAARLFHAKILTVEIVSTLIAWTIATLLLAITIPPASIVSIFAFIINELLFIFAWGAYGQPDYKI